MLRKVLVVFVFYFFSLSVLAEPLVTTTAKLVPVKKHIYLDGIVEAIQQATLFAQTSGRVIQLKFDVGDFVKQGSIIARLRDTEQKARFNQAKAGYDAVKARYHEADLEYKRITDLFSKKLVAVSARDRAQAALKTVSAQLNAAKARFDEAKEQLNHTVIRAPYSGKVTKRHIEVGETLQVGQPVISGVASQDALRFSVQVPQRLINRVRQLSSVDIILENNRRMTSDQITVFPTADLKSHSFQLRAQVFTDQHQLYPGMFVKVAIETGIEKQLLIPVSSVVYRSEITAVYVQTEKGIRFRQIRIGKQLDDQQVVLAGLTPGEQIIVDANKAAIALKSAVRGE